MGKRIKETFETTPDSATRNAITSHAADIRYYGMGAAYMVDLIASFAAAGTFVDVVVS